MVLSFFHIFVLSFLMLNTQGKWENTTILWFFLFIAFIDHYFSIILYAGGASSDDPFISNVNFYDLLQNPPRRWPATVERNNVAYIWGGEGMHSKDSFRDIVPYFNVISIDTEKQTLSYDFVSNSRDYKNFSAGAVAVMDPTNNDRVVFFGGYREIRINANEDVPLYIEQYDFSDSQWTSIIPAIAQSQANESTAVSPPRNRAYAAATAASDGNIYIAGGRLTDVNGTSDSIIIWKYDPIHQIFSPEISQENTTIRGESLKNIHAFILE